MSQEFGVNEEIRELETPDIAGESETGAVEDLQFILQETRTILLQQILAHDSGALSVEELTYRNPELNEEGIRYHLRQLKKRGIVGSLKIPVGERQRGLPNTFFYVTSKGVRLMKQANLFDEIKVWSDVYNRMERTDRIETIENLESRPEPDYGADIGDITYDFEAEVAKHVNTELMNIEPPYPGSREDQITSGNFQNEESDIRHLSNNPEVKATK